MSRVLALLIVLTSSWGPSPAAAAEKDAIVLQNVRFIRIDSVTDGPDYFESVASGPVWLMIGVATIDCNGVDACLNAPASAPALVQQVIESPVWAFITGDGALVQTLVALQEAGAGADWSSVGLDGKPVFVVQLLAPFKNNLPESKQVTTKAAGRIALPALLPGIGYKGNAGASLECNDDECQLGLSLAANTKNGGKLQMELLGIHIDHTSAGLFPDEMTGGGLFLLGHGFGSD